MPPPQNLGILLNQIQYPGQTWVESEIARAWLNKHGTEYDEITFSVRLGEGTDPGEEYAPEIRELSKTLTQKRADCVARLGTLVDLIEFKVRVAAGALGQLLIYRDLWELYHPELPIRHLIAIGRAMVPDCEATLAKHNVLVQTYPR